MSGKEDKIEAEGTIIRPLPNLEFDVQLSEEFGGQMIKGKLSGKMRINFIKLMEGDKVMVELSPYDLTKGRITFRKK